MDERRNRKEQHPVRIVYEDDQMIVCRKPAGVAVQHKSARVMDLESEVRNYLASENQGKVPYLAVINRLDQPVEGLVLLAKTKEAAAHLTAQLQNGKIEKEYLAVTEADPPEKEGILTDYLVKDVRSNLSRVTDKNTAGAKKAVLRYRMIGKEGLPFPEGVIRAASGTLVYIRLETGRHHQIRVQMAHAGMPLLGDRKYAPEGRMETGLALCAIRLRLFHPVTQKKLEFTAPPEGDAFTYMKSTFSKNS